MEHVAQFQRSQADVMSQTHHIRSRLSQALRIVDEITSVPTGPHGGQVSERHIEKLLRLRRKRDQFFGTSLFADPAWDILLELYAAELGQRRMWVGSLGVGAAVPATTALRWMKILESKGLISRSPDHMDGRRVFVALTAAGIRAMEQFFGSVPAEALLI